MQYVFLHKCLLAYLIIGTSISDYSYNKSVNTGDILQVTYKKEGSFNYLTVQGVLESFDFESLTLAGHGKIEKFYIKQYRNLTKEKKDLERRFK